MVQCGGEQHESVDKQQIFVFVSHPDFVSLHKSRRKKYDTNKQAFAFVYRLGILLCLASFYDLAVAGKPVAE